MPLKLDINKMELFFESELGCKQTDDRTERKLIPITYPMFCLLLTERLTSADWYSQFSETTFLNKMSGKYSGKKYFNMVKIISAILKSEGLWFDFNSARVGVFLTDQRQSQPSLKNKN